MSFQSRFGSNNKLKRCAAENKDHIGENTLPPEDRTGDHVALIHEALNAWALKQNPAVRPVDGNEVSGRRFGSDTSRCVRAFKTSKNLLNFEGKIDAIVGIKTVAALDLEMPAGPQGVHRFLPGKTSSLILADIPPRRPSVLYGSQPIF